jgi:transcriptional regulator with XRE-family HTH domain
LPSWLREQRLAHSWSAAEMARQLQQAAKATGDHTVTSAAILATYVRRWEAGRMGITERYRLHYCTALGIQLDDFGPPQPTPPPHHPARTAPTHQDCTALDIPPSQPGPPQPTPPAHTTTTPPSQDSPTHNILITATIPPGCHHITINLPSPATPTPPHTQPTDTMHPQQTARKTPGPRRVTW